MSDIIITNSNATITNENSDGTKYTSLDPNGITVLFDNAGTTTTTIYRGLQIQKDDGDFLINTTNGDIYLEAGSGFIDANSGTIRNTTELNGILNTDLGIKARGTGHLLLQTSNTTQIDIANSTGIATFTTLPECSVVPTTANQLVNKTYADSLGCSQSLSSVLSIGNSAGTYNINMNNQNVNGVNSVNGTTDINLYLESKGTGTLNLRTSLANQMVISTAGVATFTTLPECSVVPTTANQLVNKTYVDGLTPATPNIASVLGAGNNAGGANIIGLGTVGSVNNSAININGAGTGSIHLQIATVDQVVIDNTGKATFTTVPATSIAPSSGDDLVNKTYADALAPNAPTISITDTNTNSTYYPTFVSGSGSGQTLRADETTTPWTYNPSTGTQVVSNLTCTGNMIVGTVKETSTNTSVITNAIAVDYSTTNGIVNTSPSSASNIALTLTNVPTTAGSYTLTFLIDASTNKQYINTFNINGSSYTPVSSGGFSNITIDTNATLIIQYLSVVMAGGTVSKVITNLTQCY